MQILGPSELDPELAGDLRFVDCETAGHLDISSAGDLLALYHEYRLAHEARLTALCQQRAGRFLVAVECGEPFERVVFEHDAAPGLDRVSLMLPAFSSPASAWLFALLVPLIVFYFLKLKRPRVEIPSLVLWRQVLSDQRVNSPFQKFKRNLLLLLQILILALLDARGDAAIPPPRGRTGTAFSGADRHFRKHGRARIAKAARPGSKR